MVNEAFKMAQRLFPIGEKTCLEFGVGPGGSYMMQVNEIINNHPSTTLIGFDSWCGLPKETEGVWCPDRHTEGHFSFGKDVVLSMLKDIGAENDPRFKFVDGFFNESLTKELQSTIKNLIFVNIDVDIHSSSLEVLDFIKPLLQQNTIIYWDDWKDPCDGFNGKWGEHLAWEEWSSMNPEIKVETVRINEINQRYMRVL